MKLLGLESVKYKHLEKEQDVEQAQKPAEEKKTKEITAGKRKLSYATMEALVDYYQQQESTRVKIHAAYLLFCAILAFTILFYGIGSSEVVMVGQGNNNTVDDMNVTDMPASSGILKINPLFAFIQSKLAPAKNEDSADLRHGSPPKHLKGQGVMKLPKWMKICPGSENAKPSELIRICNHQNVELPLARVPAKNAEVLTSINTKGHHAKTTIVFSKINATHFEESVEDSYESEEDDDKSAGSELASANRA